MQSKQHDAYEVSPFYWMPDTITPGGEQLTLRPHATIRKKGTAGFLHWLQRKHPAAYSRIKTVRPDLLKGNAAGPNLSALGVGQVNPHVDEKPAEPGLMKQLLDLAKTAVTQKHQRELLEIQAEAAVEGKTPYEDVDVIATGAAMPINWGQIAIPAVLLLGVGAFFLFGPKLR